MESATLVCVTSASTRNVAVSDHDSAVTFRYRGGGLVFSGSIRVKGHGPAMQDTRILLKTLPSCASSVMEPVLAFHFSSGEHGGWLLHGTSPRFCTPNAFAAKPTLLVLCTFTEYRTRTSFFITTSFWPGVSAGRPRTGSIRATTS